jgi:hypothetical protein
MGRKDRERAYQAWCADVEMFSQWYPLSARPAEQALRELYEAGYGTAQAARHLYDQETNSSQP